MAMIDALLTSPTASLAAMLSSPGAQAPCMLLSSMTDLELAFPLQSCLKDDAPSSDKENSPLHYTNLADCSNGGTLNVDCLLEASPSQKNMSFSPQRVRPLPRAWERRPATPFAPRSDGQKIWKRIPLGELTVDPNHRMSRRQNEDKENYLRITKRLRLDMDGNNDVNIETVRTVAAVGTKWEEDNIEKGGSPKKKLRPQIEELATSTKNSLSDYVTLDQHATLSDQMTCTSIINTTNLDQPAASSNNMTLPDIGNPQNQDNENGDDNKTERNVTAAPSTPKDEAVDHTDAGLSGIGDSIDAASLITPNVGTSVANIDEAETPEERCTLVTEAILEADSNVENICQQSSTLAKNEVEAPAIQQSGEAGSVIQPELCDNQSTSQQIATNPTNLQRIAVFSVPDHDETAFLRDFLERAQSSKAARVTVSPQKKPALLPPILEHETVDVEQNPTSDMEINDEIEDDDLSPPVEAGRIDQAASLLDMKTVSPTRRSARTANRTAASRLPRFQEPPAPHFGPVLPSQNGTSSLCGTIQLKRATGNEFIFNAKSQQTLAMLARSNTKKNQGDAIHVAQRLAQLKQELQAQQENQAIGSADPCDSSAAVEVSIEIQDDASNTTKKRKRSRQEAGAGKPFQRRKNVRWPSDEELARFREPSPCKENSESRSPPDEQLTLVSQVSEDTQSENMPSIVSTSKLQDDEAGKAGPNTKKADPSEEMAKHKVRRIRKIKLDSVNGTPAPKTRSRRVEELESTEPCIDMKRPHETEESTMSIRKSSRMPLPVSTPIPLPLFSATKPKSRSTEPVKERVKPAPPVAKGSKEVAGGITVPARDVRPVKSMDEPAEQERRLDGRRRLRARS